METWHSASWKHGFQSTNVIFMSSQTLEPMQKSESDLFQEGWENQI